jgi:hypothetical protein
MTIIHYSQWFNDDFAFGGLFPGSPHPESCIISTSIFFSEALFP